MRLTALSPYQRLEAICRQRPRSPWTLAEALKGDWQITPFGPNLLESSCRFEDPCCPRDLKGIWSDGTAVEQTNGQTWRITACATNPVICGFRPLVGRSEVAPVADHSSYCPPREMGIAEQAPRVWGGHQFLHEKDHQKSRAHYPRRVCAGNDRASTKGAGKHKGLDRNSPDRIIRPLPRGCE